MKMKKITTLFVGALLASSVFSEETETVIPNLSQVIEISINPNTGWSANFFPDGSAILRFSQGGDFLPLTADAPKGSFFFEEIYNLLTPRLKQSLDYKEDMGVGFRCGTSPDGLFVGGIFYIGDMETIRKIMYGLCDKVEPSPLIGKIFFKELLSEHPLVLGDDTDGNPIPGYVKRPLFFCDDPFAENPPVPKDGNTENATPQEARKTDPDNGEAQTLLPDREAVQPDGKAATASLPLADGTQRLEAVATMDTPSSRLWLYIGILSVLCAGVVLWRIRRKK